jgi:hypothetical protein
MTASGPLPIVSKKLDLDVCSAAPLLTDRHGAGGLAPDFPEPLRDQCLRKLVALTRASYHDGGEGPADEGVDGPSGSRRLVSRSAPRTPYRR